MATVLAGVTGGFLIAATALIGPYAQYCKTLSFQDNDPGVSQIDTTTIETPMPQRTSLPGRNSGLTTWTFNIQFDPDDAFDKVILLDRDAGTLKFFRLNWPDSNDPLLVGETWTAQGYVSQCSVQGSDNGVITAQLVITLVTSVTRAAAA